MYVIRPQQTLLRRLQRQTWTEKRGQGSPGETIYKIRDPPPQKKTPHILAEIHEQFEHFYKKLFTENASGSEIDFKAFYFIVTVI